MAPGLPADLPLTPTDIPQGGWKPPLLGTGHAPNCKLA